MLRLRIIITGLPGTGKTTCILKVIKLLEAGNVKVGGFYSQESRVEGRRMGFEVSSLDGEKGWLAKADVERGGPRVGRYRVIQEDFERVGLTSLQRAVDHPDTRVIVVDEVGPMELVSERFKDMIDYILKQNKVFLATVHRRIARTLELKAKRNGEVKAFNLTLNNRTEVPHEINILIRKALKQNP
jgi:nucleoside-triphosphatase